MKQIAVIIPMHEFGEENIKLLNKAIDSVPEGFRILLSTPKSTSEKDIKDVSNRVQLLQETDGSSFAELVNAAVAKVEEKWFSILEFDDTYTPIWESNAMKYIEYMPDTSVFMFLEDIVDFNNGKYIGFGNEVAWASSFSNEIGYVDNDCLQNYFDFYMTGSIFNVADWNKVGGLKPSIKISFWYEWLLRITKDNNKVYVIPKVGYNHSLGRKDSIVEIYKKTVSDEEVQWWFDLAKRECLFREDRNKTYEEYKKNIESAEE